MRKLLLFLIILATSPAYAQDPKPTKVPLVHDGESGIWIRSDVIKLMATDLQDYKLLKEENELRKQKNAVLLENKTLYEAVTQSHQETEDIWKDAAKQEKARADAAQQELGRWYRNPGVWVTVGAVAAFSAVYLGTQVTK